YHPKSIRASAAQVFNMDFIKGPSINDLDLLDLPIVALSGAGKSIEDFEFPEKYALLAGIEGPGLPDNVPSDFSVSIKMQPEVESLNAAISVSIALYEWRRRNPL
ncbi:TrmH family RNA methyltransferase, partial [Candidatus Latescibacterota bacterium]